MRNSQTQFGTSVALNTAAVVAFLGALLASKWHSYLLFHSLVELFNIVIGASIFVVAWNSRRFQTDSYLLFLGVGFLGVACLDLVHTLSYSGMGVFPDHGANLPTQLWIGARYLEALTLLAAPVAIGRSIPPRLLLGAFGTLVVLVLASILAWDVFPVCFVEGQGLTAFKRHSEYVICLILAAAMVGLYRRRRRFERHVLGLLLAAMLVTILQELSFTLYSDPYGFWNFAGHCLKILAFVLIYKAIVETGLARPYDLLFRDLKQNEKRYRDLVELSPDAIVISRDDRVVLVNAAALRLFGCSVPHELLGRSPTTLFLADDRPRFRQRVSELRDGGRPILVEERIIRADGSLRHVEVAAAPFVDREGPAVQAILRDITERKHFEEALQAAKVSAERARSAAEEANASKDRFLAVLSHELRTPLAPIMLAAGALEADASLPESVRQDMGLIRRSVDLEARLIDDLLDINRIIHGKLGLRTEELDAAVKVSAAIEVCRAEAQAKGITLDFEPGGCCTRVRADAGRLQQIVWNLLRNAIKFTPPGGRVTVRLSNPSDEWLRIEVSDTGIGIPPEALPRLFSAFEQGGPQITREFGGLGLGLAISKGLVDLHGGRISASSAGPERGATFTVDLPISRAEPAALGEPIESAPPAPAALRVLVVEDNAPYLQVLAKLLKEVGHEPHAAASLSEAMAVVSGAPDLDLIISDLGLPDGSGLDLMQEIRRLRPDLPGIALSGYGMESDLERSRQAGFAEHLIKPVDLRKLESAIARVTRREG